MKRKTAGSHNWRHKKVKPSQQSFSLMVSYQKMYIGPEYIEAVLRESSIRLRYGNFFFLHMVMYFLKFNYFAMKKKIQFGSVFINSEFFFIMRFL